MTVIVAADKTEKGVLEKLRELGEVRYAGEAADKPAALKAALANADVLIVRSATTVTPELIADAKKLRIVARAGVGLDNVKLTADFCKQKGISVINTPAASTNAVAELAIGMMICLMRKVGFAHAKLAAGAWEKNRCTGNEIAGKTLGIVGMGRIGRAVAQKAQALGMNIAYTDLKAAPELTSYRYYATLDEMLPHADVVSLHAALPSGAPALLGAAQFARMKKGAWLVNAARGALVDEHALAAALKNGPLAGAALDVYAQEPKLPGEALPATLAELAKLENVLLTPHIGASTKEAQERVGEDLVVQLKEKLGI